MSIRTKILLGCIAMLCVTVGLGLYERLQAAALGRLAVNVYEQSLMGISYGEAQRLPNRVRSLCWGRFRRGRMPDRLPG